MSSQASRTFKDQLEKIVVQTRITVIQITIFRVEIDHNNVVIRDELAAYTDQPRKHADADRQVNNRQHIKKVVSTK